MPISVQKRPAYTEFKQVIKALLIREKNTRFGKYHLGLLWLVLEPLSSVLVLGILLGPIIGRSSGEIPYAFFLLCGFLQLKNLTTPMTQGAGALKANEGLLLFRQVEPIDAFIARFLFSFGTTVISFSLFCIIGAWIGIELSYHHLGALFLCFLLTGLIGSGLGMVIGIYSMKFNELDKVMLFVQRPLLFISCVLYPYTALPPEAQQYLYWNPLCHTVEVGRHCLFPDVYPIDDLNLVYPGVIAIILVGLGMIAYRNNRHYLKQR